MIDNDHLGMEQSRKQSGAEQITLFGELPESYTDTTSTDDDSSIVETKNQHNLTNQNRINDPVAIITIDIDGKFLNLFSSTNPDLYQCVNSNE